MAKIIIPTPLRKFTDNNSTFETKGETVKAAIKELIDTHTGLGKHLLDQNDQIRSFIKIYLGDEDINSLQKDETLVSHDAVLSIVPAIAGGV